MGECFKVTGFCFQVERCLVRDTQSLFSVYDLWWRTVTAHTHTEQDQLTLRVIKSTLRLFTLEDSAQFMQVNPERSVLITQRFERKEKEL